VIRWDEPGYVVGFTTRVGGVSEGPWSSLNLGRRNGDDPARVDENRRRALAVLGLDVPVLAQQRQCHSAVVRRARPGGPVEDGDGLWTDTPGEALLALAADCDGAPNGGSPSCTPAGGVSSPGSSRRASRRSGATRRPSSARRSAPAATRSGPRCRSASTPT
jgi:hypothetical protein